MEVPLFLAADFANKGENGKLNVLGIFNNIISKSYPAIHKSLYLVMRIVLEYGEFDHEHDINIVFIDEDGQELGNRKGKLNVPKPDKGNKVYIELIVPIDTLLVKKPGHHEFRLIINHEAKSTIPIDASLIDNDISRG